ncbi:MAG TPA: FAD-dependent oxidoreductase [Natrialbaceae archaeon]|nr:FAD-dependent oxidoreductase [Natrialbaceae archaeon]
MSAKVVVLGSGYAGTGVVSRLERELDAGDELVWVSDVDYHLVLHESHRVVRDPDVAGLITLPVDEVAGEAPRFVQGSVAGLCGDEREVRLEDGRTIDFDYAVVALGSRTAFYGIPGLEEHALTLKGLDDARRIHESVTAAAEEGAPDDPARVVVGGAGLSGIQVAGEVAALRDERGLPVEVAIVEALEEILPGNDDSVQSALRERLEAAGVEILTDDPITNAEPDVLHFDERESMAYDVLVWTGGITGQAAMADTDVETEHERVVADSTFATSNERVFAVGDSAVLEGDGNGNPVPPTAQAAWQAADVTAENVVRRMNGQPLETWTYDDKGTLISVGDEAVAHGISLFPFVDTFGGVPAEFLKKFVAARWIADVSSWNRARRAWPYL